jgi:single-strand DNA-binding protein
MATDNVGTDKSDPAKDVNQVLLRGVFAGEALLRTLPSGDELCSFRVTVPRPPGSRARVDSIDCAATKATVRRSALKCQPGDPVEITGSLRRRFWRAPSGVPTSRYEVEVSSLRTQRRRG